MLQKPMLLLDEPNESLWIWIDNALNIALQKDDGTVLLVTHDPRSSGRIRHSHLLF